MYSKYFTFIALTQGIQAAEKLIFEDNFDTLNFDNWQHEITMSGGGNWEFEYYTNNRTNSFAKDGLLHLQPTFTQETIGETALRSGGLSLWGGSPADACTNNQFWGCERNAQGSGNVINPIQSARLRSLKSISMKYGRLEVRAQLPKGDWLWPAIWMLPKDNMYGQWPASGEIDIVESRGNDASCEAGGRNKFASTLHYGPGWPMDAWETAHAEYTHTEDLSNGMHDYGLEWTPEYIKTTIDGKEVLNFPFDKPLFEKGSFDTKIDNPW
jgi:beta-glucanase (GH16 family)